MLIASLNKFFLSFPFIVAVAEHPDDIFLVFSSDFSDIILQCQFGPRTARSAAPCTTGGWSVATSDVTTHTAPPSDACPPLIAVSCFIVSTPHSGIVFYCIHPSQRYRVLMSCDLM